MKKTITIIWICFLLMGCEKYLDVKPDQKLATISSKEDIWALLNNENILNTMTTNGEDMSDNYYMELDRWSAVNNMAYRNRYIWNVAAEEDVSWGVLYLRVYHANVVMEAAEAIRSSLTSEEYNEIIGTALFYRSQAFHELLTLYSLPYSINNDGNHLGIPLRTTADIAVNFPRSTVKESYDRVIADLVEATGKLPLSSDIPTRPTKLASQSLLARVYLAIGDYNNAFLYAGNVLEEKDDLLDYSTLDKDNATPFPLYNKEVIHHTSSSGALLAQSYCFVDSVLFRSYADNDLRKDLFFQVDGIGRAIFKGSYVENINTHFTGLSVAEVYLIYIESAIRIKNIKDAVEKIGVYLCHRYKDFDLLTLSKSKEKLLAFTMTERRKELIFRNRRWEDIRRLNLLGENIFITRELGENKYVLEPGSLSYAILIPQASVEYGNISQNSR